MTEQQNIKLGKFLLEQRSIIALLVLIGVVSAINPDFFSVDKYSQHFAPNLGKRHYRRRHDFRDFNCRH